MSEGTVVEALSKVPPFPPVAVRLLVLLGNPMVEVREIAGLIANDTTFTARLLRVVNSCEFGLTDSVSNVQQAISLLGLERTRQIVVSHATAKYTMGPLRSANLRRCWQHTVATAVLADYIAHCAEVFTETAFTAGIIHDIGRLALLLQYPHEYEEVIRTAAERCLDLLDFEREEFGIDHAEAGRLLVTRWGLSSELALVAGRHHDGCEGAELNLIRIVHVACRLADVLGYEVTCPLIQLEVETILRELPLRVRTRIKLSPAELCSRIEEQILEYDSDNVEPAPAVTEDDPVQVDDPVDIAVELMATTPGEHGRFITFFVSVAALGLMTVLLFMVLKLS